MKHQTELAVAIENQAAILNSKIKKLDKEIMKWVNSLLLPIYIWNDRDSKLYRCGYNSGHCIRRHYLCDFSSSRHASWFGIDWSLHRYGCNGNFFSSLLKISSQSDISGHCCHRCHQFGTRRSHGIYWKDQRYIQTVVHSSMPELSHFFQRKRKSELQHKKNCKNSRFSLQS